MCIMKKCQVGTYFIANLIFNNYEIFNVLIKFGLYAVINGLVMLY